MKKRTKVIVVGLGLAQFALFVGQAKAQDAKTLNEVVISATKNNQKQSQTGKVVTIIDSAELSRSSGRTVADLLNQQAGLQVLSAGGNFGKDKSIFFRGAASANTVVLIDGIPVSDPSSIGTPFDLRLLSIDQVERIEILRGGQSTLYGSDAIAGVINIITKKKAQKGNGVYGVGSIGSYDTYKGTIGLNSKVNDFTYNISYSHLQTDGISEAVVPDGAVASFDKDGSKQDALNANFTIQLDKRFIVSPFVRYTHLNFSYDNDAYTDAANTGTSKGFNVGTNAVYQLDNGKFTLNYSYQNTAKNYNDAFPRKLNGGISLVDFFYNQNLGSKLNLLLGVDNRISDITYYDATGTTKPSVKLFSGYGSLFLHDLSIFNLEIGGRYNKHNKYGENTTYSVTPSIVLAKHIKLFGTASSAFRAPNLDMLFGAWGANLNLKPEKSNQLEAGFDVNLFDQKLKLRAVAFKREVKDVIVYTTGYINQDKQDDKGFEIEPSLTLGKFNIGGYYTYTEGKTTSGSTVTDYLLRRPKHLYGVNAGLNITDNFYISANYKLTGSRTDSYYNTTTWSSELRTLNSYKLLNAYAEYAFAKKRIKLFADLKNLTNEKYTEIVGYSTMGFNFNTGVNFSF